MGEIRNAYEILDRDINRGYNYVIITKSVIQKFTAAHLFIPVSPSEINTPMFQTLQYEPHYFPSLKDLSFLTAIFLTLVSHIHVHVTRFMSPNLP